MLDRHSQQKISDLYQQEDFLRHITDNMHDLAAELDLHGCIKQISASCRILGFKQADLLGLCVFDHIHPLDLPRAQKAFFYLLSRSQKSGRQKKGFQLRLKTKSGDYVWFEAKGRLLHSENGSSKSAIVVCRDITDKKHLASLLRKQKRAELQLRRQNSYLKSLHDTTLALLNHLHVDKLLEIIVQRARDLIKTPHAFLYQVTPHGDSLELKIGLGPLHDSIGLRLNTGEGLAGKILQSGQAMLVHNYHEWPDCHPALKRKPIYSVIAAPLTDAQGVAGILGLFTTEAGRNFAKDELNLLTHFAELASLALEHARLHTAAQEELLQRKQIEEQLRYTISHDALTGLYNRAYFEDILHSLSYANGAVPAVIVYDVDGLKIINDTMGHHAGDQLLVSASKIIKTASPDNAIVARIGGDEFATVLLTADELYLEHVIKTILQAVNLHNEKHPHLPLSLSTGHAFKRSAADTVVSLLKEADDNMFRVKLHRSSSVRSTIVQGLLKALEARDFITEGHGERLEELVVAIALKLSLPEYQLADLRLLAKFHDIGKVGIPDSILFKLHPLTPKEYEEMKRHCEIGHRIALAATDLAPIAGYILHHHEWWNGKGYPHGLQENNIPLPCRILAIVDAFDAMTNDRPYRKALPKENALAELRTYAGTQFDPHLVDTFIKMIDAC